MCPGICAQPMRIFSGSCACADTATISATMVAATNSMRRHSGHACLMQPSHAPLDRRFYFYEPRSLRIMRSRLILQADAEPSYRRDGETGRVHAPMERSRACAPTPAAGGDVDIHRGGDRD